MTSGIAVSADGVVDAIARAVEGGGIAVSAGVSFVVPARVSGTAGGTMGESFLGEIGRRGTLDEWCCWEKCTW